MTVDLKSRDLKFDATSCVKSKNTVAICDKQVVLLKLSFKSCIYLKQVGHDISHMKNLEGTGYVCGMHSNH